MKFFGWMQNKLHGKQSVNYTHRPSTSSASSYHLKQEPREEFSDWPHGLLAIGTFGTPNKRSNNKVSEREDKVKEEEDHEDPSSSDLDDFTPEEVSKLQKELTKLLTKTKKRKSDVNKELANLPLDRFLNCPSSLEIDRRISNALCGVTDSSDEKEEDIERTISVILGKCKAISTENKNKKKKKSKKDLSKTSVSYLFKKMFVCTEGFSHIPNPNLRDTIQESRMEKMLRMMLHKKINCHQASSKQTSTKSYLQEKQQLSLKHEEEQEEEQEQEQEQRNSNDGCKWVKTDSDFIVLEI